MIAFSQAEGHVLSKSGRYLMAHEINGPAAIPQVIYLSHSSHKSEPAHPEKKEEENKTV